MTDFSGHSKRYSSGYRLVLACQLKLKLELKWFLENEDSFIIIIILIFGNCFELKCVSSIVFEKLLTNKLVWSWAGKHSVYIVRWCTSVVCSSYVLLYVVTTGFFWPVLKYLQPGINFLHHIQLCVISDHVSRNDCVNLMLSCLP